MIVADASIIVPLLVESHEFGPRSEALLKEFPLWLCPMLWRSEVLNTLVRYVRHRGMPLESAELAFERAERIVDDTPFRPDASILRIASGTGCSGYDAHYVALSMASGFPLVSNDRKLVALFRNVARTPDEVLANR